MSTTAASLGIFDLQIQLNQEGHVPIRRIFIQLHERSLEDAKAASQKHMVTYIGPNFRLAILRGPDGVQHEVPKPETLPQPLVV